MWSATQWVFAALLISLIVRISNTSFTYLGITLVKTRMAIYKGHNVVRQRFVEIQQNAVVKAILEPCILLKLQL